MSEIATGQGFGKTILFGEHFVVYGLPAIAASLNYYTLATIKKINNSTNLFELIDLRPKISQFSESKNFAYKNMIKNIFDFFKIQEYLQITLSGNLPVFSSGIGSSAASAVAISMAINNFYNFNYDNNFLNQAAFAGELAVHGNPSGIDNTAALLGKIFSFHKICDNNFNNNIIQEINIKNKINCVLVESGVQTDIKVVLSEINILKTKYKNKFDNIFKKYYQIYNIAINALSDFDLNLLGQIMFENHDLLKELTISCAQLDKIINLSKKFGALGAKLTGTGRGGLVLVLTPDKDL
ncbi:mevalonate kinase, partial [Candidatus Babeliales bacterium]|nr:mevalonate kinase [Candidatus Babeliales bacterium]